MKRFTGQGVFLHAIPAIKAGNRVERKNNNLHKKFNGRIYVFQIRFEKK